MSSFPGGPFADPVALWAPVRGCRQSDRLALSVSCVAFMSWGNQGRVDTGRQKGGLRSRNPAWGRQRTSLRTATVVGDGPLVLFRGILAAQLRAQWPADHSLHSQLELFPLSFHRCSPLKTAWHPQLRRPQQVMMANRLVFKFSLLISKSQFTQRVMIHFLIHAHHHV